MLNSKLISKKNMNTHFDIMQMRHQYVAHAGISEHETCKYVCLLPPEKQYRKQQSIRVDSCSELFQTITASNILDEYESLVEELQNLVLEKLEKLERKIVLPNISPDKLYKWANKKIGKRIVLKEKDIENLANMK